MARIKNGILGGFSGKVGTVVGYNLGDESHMRALPRRHAKFTENELLNMAKFKLVQDHLTPLKDFLRVGFKDYGTKMGGYRSAISYTRKIALVSDDAGFYIDPALLKVSGGNLPQAVNPVAIFEDPMHVKFTWDITNISSEYRADQAMLLIYDVSDRAVITYILSGNFRSSGSQTVEIPNTFKGKEVDVYIGFVAADRSKQSDSQYLGKISIPQ
ncbi:DUF6266 family protein [Pedobacter nyackensis]|uniref:DUF6266 family protein n=1 Tax=Pedobacter nyackensis TaxID=475255 RepID=UPI00292F112C|nr:DUF6266 family protein [Pedobacter nyackensis]